jgi:gamma-glutamylputrescine oxidase
VFKQSTQHIGTYYAGTYPGAIPLRPHLQESLQCDVLIIGGGFSGLHSALRLALAGKKVVVLEASRLAWAASGRNGGQALPGWSCDMPPFEKALGLEGARRLWDSMVWAAEEMRELPERHGFDIEYRTGAIYTAVLPRRVRQLQDSLEEAEQKYGYSQMSFIPKTELPQWIASPRYLAALHDAGAAHLNPLKLAQGLAGAIEAAGGLIFEQSKAVEYRETAEGYVTRTEQGEVRSDVLVLACNAYIDRLDPQLAKRLLPVGSYQVATAPLAPEPVCTGLLPRHPGQPPAVRRRLHLPGRHSPGRAGGHPTVSGASVPATARRTDRLRLGRAYRLHHAPHSGRRPQRPEILAAGLLRPRHPADPGRRPRGQRCDPR